MPVRSILLRRGPRAVVPALAIAAVGAGAAGAGAVSPAVPEDGAFRIQRIAEGVYAAVVQPRPPMYAFANALIVVGDEGVLVVDTHQSPSAARALLRRIRALTDRPVRWVVNTHWHGDHVYGNEVYADSFPGVSILAHASTREDVRVRADSAVRAEIAELPATIRARERWLETGEGPDGAPLSPPDRDAVARSLALRRAQLAELRSLRLTPPNLTFREGATVDLGGRVVRLLHVGPAHTRGDVVVWLPEERVAAVGDLLEEGLPWVDGSSSPGGWRAALERLAALDPEWILPAHGSPARDGELLRSRLALFRELTRQVAAGIDAGLGPDEVRAAVDLTAVVPRELREDAEGREAFRRWVDRAVERALEEGGEAPADP